MFSNAFRRKPSLGAPVIYIYITVVKKSGSYNEVEKYLSWLSIILSGFSIHHTCDRQIWPQRNNRVYFFVYVRLHPSWTPLNPITIIKCDYGTRVRSIIVNSGKRLPKSCVTILFYRDIWTIVTRNSLEYLFQADLWNCSRYSNAMNAKTNDFFFHEPCIIQAQ